MYLSKTFINKNYFIHFMKLNEHKTGIALGAFVGVMHVIWSIIVASGYGQSIIDWKLSMHFLTIPIAVQSFNLTTSIELIIVAVIGGYIAGRIFAKIWNSIHK